MSEHKSTVVELQEGESLNDAIKRLAKEAVKATSLRCSEGKHDQCENNGKGMATLDGGATVQDCLCQCHSQSPQSKSKKPRKQQVLVKDPSAGEPLDSAVYSALHIYQREGEPDGSVRSNGTRERAAHGPNTRVYVHLHPFGGACSASCRERL
jgi:hypothetical protein